MTNKSNNPIACVILAAGLGTRMNSDIPKVLHKICGKPMLQHVLDAIAPLKPKCTIIVTGEKNTLHEYVFTKSGEIVYAVQKQQKGTAHALQAAMSHLKGFNGTVLVVNGDTPLLTTKTLKKFIVLHRKNGNKLSLMSFTAPIPGAYGRILRDADRKPFKVIELLDATKEQRMISEVNSGIYAIERPALSLVSKIKLNKKKREYYLTDLLELSVNTDLRSGVYNLGDESEFFGVNTRKELSIADDVIKDRLVDHWVSRGVSFVDMYSVYIEQDVSFGIDTIVYPNVHIQGKTKIGKNCIIYPNVRVIDSVLKDNVTIKDSSLIEESIIGNGASVGPFAHLRPGSSIGESAKIGNFVEVKKSNIGAGTKAMHLTYIGDSEVGNDVNIGAGTITCNYDGIRKHKTKIGRGVFVGSDSQLVAPVDIGEGSYIGAGTTVTKDIPPGHLATSRTKQRNIEWKPLTPKRKSK